MSEICRSDAACQKGVCWQEQTIQKALSRIAQLEKAAAIGQVASGIVHDFNNIIAATRLFADAIAKGAPSGSDGDAYAIRIIACCDMATKMVGQVYAFANDDIPSRPIVRVNTVLEEARVLLLGLLPSLVELTVADTSSGAVIAADANQLVRVLLNIGINAGDAIGNRGGRIIISSDIVTTANLPSLTASDDPAMHAFTTAEPRPDTSYVMLTVTDTGPGIPGEVMARMFEPFFTTKGQHRGLGLGLAIARKIVDAHQGILVVRSRAGEGAQFLVLLPVLAPEVQESSQFALS